MQRGEASMSARDEQFSERYLQISRNLMVTFPKHHLPVRLFVWDQSLGRVVEFHEAGKRMKPEKEREADRHCREGRLYLFRDDYRVYAAHLSKHLGLVLTEDDLNEREVAEIFFKALVGDMEKFHEQPTRDNLVRLQADLGILSEYLWTNPCRVGFLARTLNREYSLEVHAVNSIFIGLGIRVMAAGSDMERLELGSLALGLALHDVGMLRVPEFIKEREGILMHKDREAMKRHPDMGANMLFRLKIDDPVVRECVVGHHERVDGTGYPGRLRGDSIGMYARICGLADAFCATMGERPYHEAKEVKDAVRQFVDNPAFDSRYASLLFQLVERRYKPCPLPFA